MAGARLAKVLYLTLALGPVPVLAANAPAAEVASESPVWIVDDQGRRFRIRFDPGHRLYAGAGAVGHAAAGSSRVDPVVEIGLALRAPPPPALAEVFWKRDHEFGQMRLRAGGDGVWLDGRLYRALFLRHSREGSLTIPTTPPLRLALPFDVGVRLELGRFTGTVPLSSPGAALETGVVRGEALADFLRSEHPGRWLAVGVVGHYDVRFERAQQGRLLREHRVAPLLTVAASARGESARGLLAGGLRAEWGRVWSSRRGWGQEVRIEGEIEVTPVAVNDLPLSFVLGGSLELDAHGPEAATRFRTFAGARLGAPLP